MALIPGVCASPQNDAETPSEMLESAKFRLGESPAKLYHIASRGGGRGRGLVLEIITAGKERHRYLIRKFLARRVFEAERRVLIDWNFTNTMKRMQCVISDERKI